MTFHEYTIKIRIAEDLTEDGLTLTSEKLHAALCRAFPFARMSGIEVELVPVEHPPYPWCHGNPTKEDCIRDGFCKRKPSCGD